MELGLAKIMQISQIQWCLFLKKTEINANDMLGI